MKKNKTEKSNERLHTTTMRFPCWFILKFTYFFVVFFLSFLILFLFKFWFDLTISLWVTNFFFGFNEFGIKAEETRRTEFYSSTHTLTRTYFIFLLLLLLLLLPCGAYNCDRFMILTNILTYFIPPKQSKREHQNVCE